VHHDDGASLTLSGNAAGDVVALKFASDGTNVYHQITSNSDSGVMQIRAGVAGGGHKLQFLTGGASDTGARLEISQTGNQTITLDDDDNSVFSVVDNKGSPVTYLTLTQDGACEMGHTGSTTTLEGSGTTLRGVSWVRTRVNGNPVWSGEKSGSATFVQYNGGNVTNCNSIYGATTQHTANTSVGDHVLMYNHVFELAASGPSGAVTCDADFKHQSGVPTGANGYTAISHVTIVNSNASHNYIFKYNMKSGNGSVAAFDSDATNLTDGTGYTCAPGKVAMFEIRTVRVGGTAITNQIHMVRCLGKS
jgi:hypothetical protein